MGSPSVWGSPRGGGDTHLGAEGEVVAQGGDVVLQQVDQALVEVVVLALHVRVPAPRGGGARPLSGGLGAPKRGAALQNELQRPKNGVLHPKNEL